MYSFFIQYLPHTLYIHFYLSKPHMRCVIIPTFQVRKLKGTEFTGVMRQLGFEQSLCSQVQHYLNIKPCSELHCLYHLRVQRGSVPHFLPSLASLPREPSLLVCLENSSLPFECQLESWFSASFKPGLEACAPVYALCIHISHSCQGHVYQSVC